jgi:hypothetical protein
MGVGKQDNERIITLSQQGILLRWISWEDRFLEARSNYQFRTGWELGGVADVVPVMMTILSIS